MTANKYDCIIIGAGISGLLSALVLSKHGKRVLVIERSQGVGGNCRSYKVDGFTVDTGPHAITHLKKGPLRVLMDNYFDYIPALIPYGTYYLRTEKGLQPIPSTVHEFATFDILPKMDRVSLIQAITKSMTLSALGTNIDNESVHDWLPPNLSKNSYDFVDAMAYLLSGKSMRETSVKRMLDGSSFVRDDVMNTLDNFNNGYPKNETGIVRQLQDKITNISRLVTNDVCYAQAYPKHGLKGVLNAVLYSLPDRVEIMSGTAVEEILVEDGNAYGVSTADDTFYADFIVHSGFAKNIPDLVADLPSSYAEDLGRIDQTTSLT
ncbi:MAG: NAD(P)/FAD-dependent oxidoreductase, partial [Methanosarcinales archaeon]|nr:NAD(P)/FAD-dependent oxidoreductase [Methanosarcinales archaeon]